MGESEPIHYTRGCILLKWRIKPGWRQSVEVKQKLAGGVLYKSTDIIIMRSPVFSEGWLFLLWANALNCSMQMRAITKLLGEEMTAEVGFIGGLTQLSWQPHRITQLSNGCHLIIRPEIASALFWCADPFFSSLWLLRKLSIWAVKNREKETCKIFIFKPSSLEGTVRNTLRLIQCQHLNPFI